MSIIKLFNSMFKLPTSSWNFKIASKLLPFCSFCNLIFVKSILKRNSKHLTLYLIAAFINRILAKQIQISTSIRIASALSSKHKSIIAANRIKSKRSVSPSRLVLCCFIRLKLFCFLTDC